MIVKRDTWGMIFSSTSSEWRRGGGERGEEEEGEKLIMDKTANKTMKMNDVH